VALISCAGKNVDVCAPLTQDPGKVIAAFHKVKISGESNFVNSIRVAQLVLRHRQKTGKTQEQRIILFVGSPVTADIKELEDLGRQLRKFSIAIDIISFGEPNVQLNEEKLDALYKAANNKDQTGKDNSHLVPIPSGNLTDVLSQLTGVQPGSVASMELDPELAWALQLSTQTYEQENKPPAEKSTQTQTQPQTDVVMQDTTNEEDPELLEAIRMSLMANQPPAAEPNPNQTTEDDDLLRAIELSQQVQVPSQVAEKPSEKPATEAKTEVSPEKTESTTSQSTAQETSPMELDFSDLDPSVLESIVFNLPNVDKNDPEIQQFLKNFKDDKDKDKEKK
jgi:26S proteasome regulatory subunit N10